MEQNQINEYVSRAKNGDQDAFTDLYNASYKMIYLTCIGHLKNQESAEDATQDTFILIYNNINSLMDNNTFFGWAKTIAVRVCLQKIRSMHGDISYDEAVDNGINVEGDASLEDLPDSMIMEDEKRKIILDILKAELSEVQYQTVFMFYYDNMPIEQIADIMLCPIGTVKTRLKASRAKIRTGIEAYEQKHGDKLCAIGTFPALGMLFNWQSVSTPVAIKGFGLALSSAVSSGAAHAASAATSGAVQAASSSASATPLNSVGATGLTQPASAPVGVDGFSASPVNNPIGSQGFSAASNPSYSPVVRQPVNSAYPQGTPQGISQANPPSYTPAGRQVAQPANSGSVTGASHGYQPNVPTTPTEPVAPIKPTPVQPSPVQPTPVQPSTTATASANATASNASKSTAVAKSSLTTKIVAGIVATTVIGAGAVGIVTLNNKSKDKIDTTTAVTEQYYATDAYGNPVPPTDDDTDISADSVIPASYNVGDTFTYGNYLGDPISWLVLDVDDDGNYLVISEKIIEGKEYHEEEVPVTWEDCSLRTWLNTEFMNEAFTDEELGAILTTTVTADATSGNDTQDNIFLLSADEAKLYFPTDESIFAYPSDALCSAHPNDIVPDRPIPWWLRSTGYDEDNAFGPACIEYYDNNFIHYVDATWDNESTLGIRPAMWISPNGTKMTLEKFYGTPEKQAELDVSAQDTVDMVGYYSDANFYAVGNTMYYEYWLNIEPDEAGLYIKKNELDSTMLAAIPLIKAEAGVQDTITVDCIWYNIDGSVFAEYTYEG